MGVVDGFSLGALGRYKAYNLPLSILILGEYGESMKLLIRNLPGSITELEIREMFAAFGMVQSCVLVIDKETGQSKGFGFVEMPKSGEAKVAMKSLNGKDIMGRSIRVKKESSKGKEVSESKAVLDTQTDDIATETANETGNEADSKQNAQSDEDSP